MHRRQPDKIILLVGTDQDLYWGGFFDRPFRLFGIQEVYLAPGQTIGEEVHGLRNTGEFVYPGGLAVQSLGRGRAVVYDVGEDSLTDITMQFFQRARTLWPPKHPQRVDVGEPSYAAQLGPTWQPIEQGFRWMPKRATITLGGPERIGQTLILRGYAPANQLVNGPVAMTVTVDAKLLGSAPITEPDAAFEFRFPLPMELVGAETIEVLMEVDHTFRPNGDTRDLGAAFGVIEIW